MIGFTWIDLFIVFAYLVGVAAAGLYLAGKQKSSYDYFLGAYDVPWLAVLFSIVATETSALTVISVPAIAYTGNLSFLQITLGYFLGRVVVALFFLPQYFQHNLETAYSFIGQRFGQWLRQASSLTFMITRLLADGVRVFACAIPVAMIIQFLGFKASPLIIYALSITVVSLVTLIYTYLGGIRAVIWTDTLQLGLYLGGAILALVLILSRLPQGLIPALVFLKEKKKFSLFSSGLSLSLKEFLAEPYTFLVAVIGGAFFSIASHGTDQLIVQRLLATKKLASSQKALIGSGLFIIGQFALFLGVGLFLFAFYQGQPPSELGLATSDEVFIKFVVEEMPPGASGLIIASILAAAMSTLASAINSLASSTFFDLKLFTLKKQGQWEASGLRLSRLFSLFWGITIFLAALFFAHLQLNSPGKRPAVIELGLGIASYTYGGLLGLFLLGLLCRKAGQKEALYGFFTALVTLLFLVKGPIQTLLPGEGLALAWPLYVVVGSAIVVIVGGFASFFRK
ncbi:MAG: sodium:solute symporter [Candidatus Aminicenantes bacterium]|nr:sodium:solute symporter [Candidatus Aminicenantes bacterium]